MWTLFLGLVFAQSPGLLDASESLKSSEQDEVHVQIDWQAHPAMHIPWKRFGKGLTSETAGLLSFKLDWSCTGAICDSLHEAGVAAPCTMEGDFGFFHHGM